MRKTIVIDIIALSVIFCFSSCSINRFAVDTAARMLASPGGSALFSSDEDPELVAASLPLVMKAAEAMVLESPENSDLLRVTGSLFIMYANAFIQGPAEMLPLTEWEAQETQLKRAKNMYLRAYDYLWRALILKYPAMENSLSDHSYSSDVFMITADDAELCYWTASALLSAFALNPYDFDLGAQVPLAYALAFRGLTLDETWNNGAQHELFLSLSASLPEALLYDYLFEGENPVQGATEAYYRTMETSAAKLDHHYHRALELSHSGSASAHVAMANAAAVPAQDIDAFREYLNAALAIDPERLPENRLVTILAQRKALWLLEHESEFFLLP